MVIEQKSAAAIVVVRQKSFSVVNEGPNIDDKEESDSLSTVQPNGDTLLLAKESVTSFEPRSIKLRTGTRQPSESMRLHGCRR